MGLSAIPASTKTIDAAHGASKPREAGGFFGIMVEEISNSTGPGQAAVSGGSEHHDGVGAGIARDQARSAESSPTLTTPQNQRTDAPVTEEGAKAASDAEPVEDHELPTTEDETEAHLAAEAAAAALAQAVSVEFVQPQSMAAPAENGGEVEASGSSGATLVALNEISSSEAVEPDSGERLEVAPEGAPREGHTFAEPASDPIAEGGGPKVESSQTTIMSQAQPSADPGVYTVVEDGQQVAPSAAATSGDSAEAKAFLAAVAESRKAARDAAPAAKARGAAATEEASGSGEAKNADAVAKAAAAESTETVAENVLPTREQVEPVKERHGGHRTRAAAKNSGWRLWAGSKTSATEAPATPVRIAPQPAPVVASPKTVPSTVAGTGSAKEPAVVAADPKDAPVEPKNSGFEPPKASETTAAVETARTASGSVAEESEGSARAAGVAASKIAESASPAAEKIPARAEPQEDARAAKDIFRQVQGGLRVAFLQRGERAVIQLMPEALGRVQVEIARTSQGLTANFRVETVEAREALTSQVVQLKSGFESRGVNLVSVNVELGNERSAGSGGQTGQQRSHKRQARQVGALNTDTTSNMKESSWKPWGFETRA